MNADSHLTERRPEGAAEDWTIPQDWTAYSAEDHHTWDVLFERQVRQLPGRASQAFLDGVDVLKLSKPGIPDFEELSERLMKETGWQVVAVPGLVPDEVFFDHLANRRFVAGNFIRRPNQLDYLQEPDVFHDVFGHVPMLANPVFADYMQAYGEGGQRALKFDSLDHLARLYWYTVEFGLIEEEGELRIYGSGIVSSHGESVFALDDPSPNRIRFDLKRVMRTDYRIDDFQQVYFVIPGFEHLLDVTAGQDFAPIYDELEDSSDLAPEDVIDADALITRGTQLYAREQAAASPA